MKNLNFVIEGSREKPILLDVYINNQLENKPVVIFCHGYKGFKDWGAWNLVAEEFVKKGFNFIKFNFSYNGTTIENPNDFDDLKAFGENNYITELNDLSIVIDWINQENGYQKYFDTKQIYLIGHSRGGGIALLEGKSNPTVSKIVTWATVSNYFERLPGQAEIEKWKKDGVIYQFNSRTKQQMPLYYQFYESLMRNKEQLDIEEAVSKTNKPILFIHGEEDKVVLPEESVKLNQLNDESKLLLVKNGTHTFNTSHPWNKKELSDELYQVVNETIHFLLE